MDFKKVVYDDSTGIDRALSWATVSRPSIFPYEQRKTRKTQTGVFGYHLVDGVTERQLGALLQR